MRFLLVRHRYATCIVALAALMSVVKYGFVPIVLSYGNAGFVAAMAAIFALDFWLDRKPTDDR